MRKFLSELLILFIPLVVIVGFLQAYWSNVEVPYYKWHYDILYSEKSYDCVIIGNSISTHGIRPSILDSTGLSFVNLSLNGANSNFYLKWYINHFRSSNIKPNYMIINMPLTGARRYEHDASFFPGSLLTSNTIEFSEYSTRILWNSKLNALKFREKNSRLLKAQERALFDYSDYDKGYITYLGCPPGFQFHQPITEKEDKHMIEALNDLLGLLKEDGIEVIFVTPPTRDGNSESRTRLQKLTRNIAKRAEIRYLDYQSNPAVVNRLSNTSHYSDNLHLNRKGSRAFSFILRDDLQDILLSKEH